MQTEKMIYPTQSIADAIAGKLCEHKGKHVVIKVSTGYQVCPVTVCQGAVSPNNAAPYPKPKTVGDGYLDLQPQIEGDVVTLVFPFIKETPAFVGVHNHKHDVLYISKKQIKAFTLLPDHKVEGAKLDTSVQVTVPLKWAKDRDLC